MSIAEFSKHFSSSGGVSPCVLCNVLRIERERERKKGEYNKKKKKRGPRALLRPPLYQQGERKKRPEVSSTANLWKKWDHRRYTQSKLSKGEQLRRAPGLLNGHTRAIANYQPERKEKRIQVQHTHTRKEGKKIPPSSARSAFIFPVIISGPTPKMWRFRLLLNPHTSRLLIVVMEINFTYPPTTTQSFNSYKSECAVVQSNGIGWKPCEPPQRKIKHT